MINDDPYSFPYYTKGQADGVTFQGFVEFVNQQAENNDRSYEYVDNFNCPFAQYLQSLGYTKDELIVGSYTYRIDRNGEDPKEYYLGDLNQLITSALSQFPRTWSHLHSRLLKLD